MYFFNSTKGKDEKKNANLVSDVLFRYVGVVRVVG